MGCHLLLQRIFLTQGLNLGLPNCRQMLYHLSYQGCPSNFINSYQLIQNICFFLGSFSVGSEGKESACDAGDLGLIPGEGNGYPHPVFLPGEFNGQRSLAVYSPWSQRVRTEQLTLTFLLEYW